jgi:hypothetical protein
MEKISKFYKRYQSSYKCMIMELIIKQEIEFMLVASKYFTEFIEKSKLDT